MSSAVQFYGIEQVMQATENRNIPAWGIWQMRQFLFKYEGNSIEESLQLLQKTLECLSESGSTATYTIKFFEQEGNKPVKIKENTPCDGGSFNFRMVDPEQRMELRNSYQLNSPSVLGTLKGIDERLKRLEEGDTGEPEEETLMESIGNVLKDPQQLGEYIDLFQKLFKPNTTPAYIGRINRDGQNSHGSSQPGRTMDENLSNQSEPIKPTTMNQPPKDETEFLTRIGNALDVIREKDPRICEHLEKLAVMATTKPAQFDLLITMLDAQ